ncbi:polysaccharide lyase 8 family protein [Streptomyces sp. JJ36]|uniref:polysaccharide lyase 8 family protein n=1 Tax=Streptomyces sp. JJ36 TaxID=2736645 RepID=UPI001F373EE9|nr:polysaccharide lyase 8 family protein [Streptomyces sp. JJ36]MCF6526313.1 polysaccharide lyase 8 family protein [Streptomyces sp. JJ36]
MPPSPRWSRRGFLAASAASAAAAGAFASGGAPSRAAGPPAPPGPAPAADEFAVLRRRWLDLRLGTGFDPAAEPYAGRLRDTGARAAALRAAMTPTDDGLFPGHPFDPPSGITQSYARLAVLAEAYVQPGTGLTGDAGVLRDLLAGLEHVHDRVYHAGTTRYGNWWEWQIGSPRLLLDLIAMVYEELPPERRAACLAAVDHFVPETLLDDYAGVSTGANRVDFCRVFALRGVLGSAPRKLGLVGPGLAPVFPYVTEGDGLYADGSFIQHTWVAYSGTYGHVLLDGLGRLFTLLDGTRWEVTGPGRRIVLDSVEKAYAPLLHDGLVMDSVSGRAISRGRLTQDTRDVLRSDHSRGHLLAAAIVLLAGCAGPAERARWHALVRGWIARDTALPVLTDPQFGVADLARLHAVDAEDGPVAEEPVAHTVFPAMARAVHRRRGWCANIAMASRTVAHYECGNGENPRGWHTGSGLLCWWGPRGTLDQYTDHYWPTVDWYRLPGTTVSTRRLPDNAGGEWGAPKPDVAWVGGVTDGEFAAVGQHLKGLESTLDARKSWFCAADAIVCLGAGISAADGTPVETIVDNRNLGPDGTARLTVDGVPQPGPGTVVHPRARWAHLAGHGGWVFPGGTRLTTRRETRTGSWADINAGGSPEPVTRHWLTLWTDHGTDPHDARYAYVLLPGASRGRSAARAAAPGWLRIDANTAAAQGVTLPRLGLTAVNFWRAGTVGRLHATGPAAVLLRRQGRTVQVRVAGPTRTGEPFDVIWDHPVARVTEAGDGVRVRETGDRLRLLLDPGTAGATLGCTALCG